MTPVTLSSYISDGTSTLAMTVGYRPYTLEGSFVVASVTALLYLYKGVSSYLKERFPYI